MDDPQRETPVRILMVEDSEADYLLIKRHLDHEDLPFRIHRIDRLEDIKAALLEPHDLVLYDYEIPGLEFSDAMHTIKAIDEFLPIILVSGTVDERMSIGLLHKGLADFIPKDNLTRLVSAIKRALREAEERIARVNAEDALRKLARVVEQSPTGILITDTQPAIEYVNDALLLTTGYERAELLGRNPGILSSGKTPSTVYRDLWQTLGQGEVWRGEFHNVRKDGSGYIGSATLAPIRKPDGTITHYVGIVENITAQRESEQLIERLAYYDLLTELPNRTLMLEQLRQVMAQGQSSGSHAALILLDIDGFKFINDIQSYAIGDKILKRLTIRLKRCTSSEDIVARIGGDQFAVIIRDLGRDERAATVRAREKVEAMYAEIDRPYDFEASAQGLSHTTSTGICLFVGNERSPNALLNRAELALQHAKEDGRNLFRFFSADLQTAMEARSTMESDLRQAVQNDEFRIHLQSQYDHHGILIGAEALLRWLPPNSPPISPDRFIPLIEANGLIVPIGRHVLDQACILLQSWQKNPATTNLTLAVNISARQFHQPDFVQELCDALERYAIRPGGLKLELTESAVLDDQNLTQHRMNRIRSLGVGLSLDDFGTGYSSLSYLKNLPFEQLKIDRSFVSDMTASASSDAIVRAILAMGQALDLVVVAEGVETEAQFELLKSQGCRGFQGFYLSRPQALDDWRPVAAPVMHAKG